MCWVYAVCVLRKQSVMITVFMICYDIEICVSFLVYIFTDTIFFRVYISLQKLLQNQLFLKCFSGKYIIFCLFSFIMIRFLKIFLSAGLLGLAFFINIVGINLFWFFLKWWLEYYIIQSYSTTPQAKSFMGAFLSELFYWRIQPIYLLHGK